MGVSLEKRGRGLTFAQIPKTAFNTDTTRTYCTYIVRGVCHDTRTIKENGIFAAFVRSMRFYLRVRSIVPSWQIRALKRLFDTRGTAARMSCMYVCHPCTMARGGLCHVARLHGGLLFVAAKYNIKRLSAARRLAFIYYLCAFFVPRLCCFFFRSSSLVVPSLAFSFFVPCSLVSVSLSSIFVLVILFFVLFCVVVSFCLAFPSFVLSLSSSFFPYVFPSRSVPSFFPSFLPPSFLPYIASYFRNNIINNIYIYK